MAIIVTSSRRRIVMTVLLALAMTGLVIRYFAPNPSPLRDFGTLLMVMWLPAVGNLVGYLIRKIPRRPPPVVGFAAGSAFAPQLQVQLEAIPLPSETLAALNATETGCILVIGKRGYRARMGEPVVPALASSGGQRSFTLELMHPRLALPHLKQGTEFHLLVGPTAVAQGRVSVIPAEAGIQGVGI